MDQSAITEIQKASAVEAANKTLQEFDNTPPAIVIPENYKLQPLTNESETINHYKGSMDTDSLSDFAAYIEHFDQEGSACFINTDQMSAKTFINLGTTMEPTKGDFTAKLNLKKTPEYRDILDVNDDSLSQLALSDFIEDWNHCITCHNNDDNETIIDNKTAVKAIRSVTISAEAKKTFEEQDFKAQRSAMESISCDTDNGLPAIIKFTCIPYTELEERTFSLRASINTGGNEPKFKLRVIALEAIKEEMAQELMEKLKAKFTDLKTETYIGSFQP